MILQCSGASGVQIAPESEDELRFGEALDALLRQLALLIVARRRGRQAGRARRRHAAATSARVERCARAVANSPLVKTALHGADPNWGRIAQAVGDGAAAASRRWRSTSRSRASRCAATARRSPTTSRRWPPRSPGDEVEYEIGLPGEGAETEVFFSDLGHEYVTINAEYTT